MLRPMRILLKIWVKSNVKLLNYPALMVIHMQIKERKKKEANLEDALLASTEKMQENVESILKTTIE